jgi:hypothetical protein
MSLQRRKITRTAQLSLLLLAVPVASVEAFTPSLRPAVALSRPSLRSSLHFRERFVAAPPNNNLLLRLRAQNGDNNLNGGEASVASFLAPTNDDPLNQQLDKLILINKAESLRPAIDFLKEHRGMTLSVDNWNKLFDAIEVRTAGEGIDVQTGDGRTDFPLQSPARQEMTDMYDVLSDRLVLYGATAKTPLAAGSHTVAPDQLESILDLPMSALTPQQTNTLLWAGISFAVVEGILAAATGLSLNVLVLTTLVAAFLDRLLLNGAVFESTLKLFSPQIQTKMIRHEAGHFLAAYLAGCPVEGVVLSAWEALKDDRFKTRAVSAGTSFFDPDLSQQINDSGQVTRSSVDRYSVIVMAGIAAEAEHFGKADGGAGDELALISFLTRLNGPRPAGRTAPWNSETIRNQARWGALQAVLQLREYNPVYEALVQCMEQSKKGRRVRLADCILAMETAARQHGLGPLKQPLGYLVKGADGTTTWTTEAPPVLEARPEPKPLNEEETLQALQEYKTEVQEKLKQVEEQLKKLS